MEKRGKNKKAQFYLIAAVIIVMVVIGLSGITNYSKSTKKPVKFYDLSSELSEESSRVIDYGIYSGKDKIEDFIDYNLIEYAKEKEIGAEFVFVYGNTQSAKIATYTIGGVGKISFDFGSTHTAKEIQGYSSKKEAVSGVNGVNVQVKILEKYYTFPPLENQQNFYFVIVKEKDKETYVATNPTFI